MEGEEKPFRAEKDESGKKSKPKLPDDDGNSNSEVTLIRILPPAQDGDTDGFNASALLSSRTDTSFGKSNLEEVSASIPRKVKRKSGNLKNKKTRSSSRKAQPGPDCESKSKSQLDHNQNRNQKLKLKSPSPTLTKPKNDGDHDISLDSSCNLEESLSQVVHTSKKSRLRPLAAPVTSPTVSLPLNHNGGPHPRSLSWKRIKQNFVSVFSERFGRFYSRFTLDIHGAGASQKTLAAGTGKKIVQGQPSVSVKGPKLERKQKLIVSPKSKPDSPSAPKSEPKEKPPKPAAGRFSLMNLRKSRSERGVKSFNLEMGFGLVFRRQPIRRNRNSNKVKHEYKTTTKVDRPQSENKENDVGGAISQETSRSNSPLLNRSAHAYAPMPLYPVNFDTNFLFQSNNLAMGQEQVPIPVSRQQLFSQVLPIQGNALYELDGSTDYNGEKAHPNTSESRSKRTSNSEMNPREYYPRTEFTAQFAHLLPTGRY